MPDVYADVRSIPLRQLMANLGIDLSQFKKRSGKAEWYGKCVFHEAKTNNTAFSFTDEMWNCFSCQSRGRGAIDFVKEYKKTGFKESVEWLRGLTVQPAAINAPTGKSRPAEAIADGVLKPFTGSYHKFAVPSPWLDARIPDKTIQDRYGVFQYHNPARKSAYDNRILIPVKDITGQLFGYLGRRIEEQSPTTDACPKYLFPKNLPKSRFLFGSDVLKAGAFGPLPLKRLYLVESPFCVMKFASLNLPAVSSFGWSVSQEQIQVLASLTKGCIYLPDSNKRQEAATHLSALAQKLWIKFPLLPNGCLDPENLSREQILAL